MANRIKEKYMPKKKYFDYPMLFLVIFLIFFGMVMIFSTSSYKSTVNFGNPYHWVLRQGIAIIIGTVFMAFLCRMDYRWFNNKIIAVAGYGVSILLLIAVLIVGAAKRVLFDGFPLEDFSFSLRRLQKSFWLFFWLTYYRSMPIKCGGSWMP